MPTKYIRFSFDYVKLSILCRRRKWLLSMQLDSAKPTITTFSFGLISTNSTWWKQCIKLIRRNSVCYSNIIINTFFTYISFYYYYCFKFQGLRSHLEWSRHIFFRKDSKFNFTNAKLGTNCYHSSVCRLEVLDLWQKILGQKTSL